jgi:hypothetical protein
MRTKRLFGRCEDFHTGRRTFNDYFHFFTFCLTAICIPYDSDDRFRTLQVHSVVGNRLGSVDGQLCILYTLCYN